MMGLSGTSLKYVAHSGGAVAIGSSDSFKDLPGVTGSAPHSVFFCHLLESSITPQHIQLFQGSPRCCDTSPTFSTVLGPTGCWDGETCDFCSPLEVGLCSSAPPVLGR